MTFDDGRPLLWRLFLFEAMITEGKTLKPEGRKVLAEIRGLFDEKFGTEKVVKCAGRLNVTKHVPIKTVKCGVGLNVTEPVPKKTVKSVVVPNRTNETPTKASPKKVSLKETVSKSIPEANDNDTDDDDMDDYTDDGTDEGTDEGTDDAVDNDVDEATEYSSSEEETSVTEDKPHPQEPFSWGRSYSKLWDWSNHF